MREIYDEVIAPHTITLGHYYSAIMRDTVLLVADVRPEQSLAPRDDLPRTL